jgi:hypothetical protein
MKRFAVVASCTIMMGVSGCGSSPTVPPTPLNPLSMSNTSMTAYGPNPQMATNASTNTYAGSPTDSTYTSSSPDSQVGPPATGVTPSPSPSPSALPSPESNPEAPSLLPQTPAISAPDVTPPKKSFVGKVVDGFKSVGSKIIGLFKKKT